ncbi:MAG: hypothetical protein ABIO80_00875 [Sphingomicrobium sp.]
MTVLARRGGQVEQAMNEGARVGDEASSSTSDGSRARLISLAAIAIILLSAGAALLPIAGGVKGSVVIGALLIAAGLAEVFAGMLRGATKAFAVAAGSVTVLAGVIFLLKPTDHLFPNVVLVTAWLIARSAIILVGSGRTGGSVRTWTMLSAGMDLVLAVLLITGLSIATIIVNLFGPTQPMIASFAWVLAASFIVNGLMLLEVAGCERSPD